MLLINAVCWSEAYPPNDPLGDVLGWYQRRLAHLPRVQLHTVTPEEDVIRAIRRHADAVIISGSPRDAWADDAVNLKLCGAIHECDDLGIPFLGICYGHQLLGRALGGEMGPHPCGLELGTIPVRLTEAGKNFPLFQGVPEQFDVLLSHADAVLSLPPRCELLATGDFTKIQAFHRDGRLIGVQFHPELEPETLRYIWSPRRQVWRDKVDFDLNEHLDTMQSTPHAVRMLENFVTQLLP